MTNCSRQLRQLRSLAIFCAAIAITGCRTGPAKQAIATTPPLPSAIASRLPERLPSSPQDQGVRWASATAPQNRTAVVVSQRLPAAEAVPSGPALPGALPQQPVLRLSLFDVIETSLLRNPDLTALRQNEGVGLGVLGVAQTYPFNPFVQVQATPAQRNTDGTSGTTYHYVLVMQTLQLAHQQRHREESALASLNSVRWNILQAELNNIAQSERLYFTALYQRGLRDIAQATAELNDQLLTIAQRQLEAGQISGSEAAIVRLDARSARSQSRLVDANYQTALLDLRRQMNVPLSEPLEITGGLHDLRWSSALPERLARAKCPAALIPARSGGYDPLTDLVAGRPDVMAARSDLAVARANTNLARASRIPDLQLGPYYQRTESGTTYWGFRAQTDIPVINNGVPLVRQREAEIRQRHTVWEQLFLRTQIEAQTAVDRYERARRVLIEAGPYTPDSLPDELRRLERQFKANEVDVVRVVTARTSMIQLRRVYLDLLNELAQAAAAVTASTGAPAQSIVAIDARAPR